MGELSDLHSKAKRETDRHLKKAIPKEVRKAVPEEAWSPGEDPLSEYMVASREARLAAEAAAKRGQGGNGEYPVWSFEFPELKFQEIQAVLSNTDFDGLYERIGRTNAKLIAEQVGLASQDAQRLSSQFTEQNVRLFGSAMRRITPMATRLLQMASRNAARFQKGEIPRDDLGRLVTQSGSRVLSGGYGLGTFGGNQVARDLGLSSLDLIQRGDQAAQQIYTLGANTAGNLLVRPENLYGAQLNTRVANTLISPAQYLTFHAQQDQFNAQQQQAAAAFNSTGEFNADSANAANQFAAAQADYNAKLGELAYQLEMENLRAAENQSSGFFGSTFGDSFGWADTVADIAVPIIGGIYGGGYGGAAAGAGWQAFQAQYRGTDTTQAAVAGGISGYQLGTTGTQVSNWWQGYQNRKTAASIESSLATQSLQNQAANNTRFQAQNYIMADRGAPETQSTLRPAASPYSSTPAAYSVWEPL